MSPGKLSKPESREILGIGGREGFEKGWTVLMGRQIYDLNSSGSPIV